MTNMCPNCGYDLAGDLIVHNGDIIFDPRGETTWQGEKVRLGRSKRALIGTLLKAEGRPVSISILCERIGYDGDNAIALMHQHVFQLRKRLPALPIETIRGVGFRWAA